MHGRLIRTGAPGLQRDEQDCLEERMREVAHGGRRRRRRRDHGDDREIVRERGQRLEERMSGVVVGAAGAGAVPAA